MTVSSFRGAAQWLGGQLLQQSGPADVWNPWNGLHMHIIISPSREPTGGKILSYGWIHAGKSTCCIGEPEKLKHPYSYTTLGLSSCSPWNNWIHSIPLDIWKATKGSSGSNYGKNFPADKLFWICARPSPESQKIIWSSLLSSTCCTFAKQEMVWL